MSKSNTAVKPISSTVSAEYQLSPVAPPAYDQTIVDRIGKQHSRIYQVAGSVQIARAAIDTLHIPADGERGFQRIVNAYSSGT
jgi:hypothetical protein